MRPLRIAIPNKGRLHKPSLELLSKAGLSVGEASRSYATKVDGLEVVLARAADIPIYVHFGAVDLGVTGHDLVLEKEADVYELLDLGFGWCKMVVAVPEESPVNSVYDLPQGSRVATSFPRIASSYFEGLGLSVEVVEVEGAVEIAPRLGLADAIVDLATTGATLRENRLREIAVVLEASARLICNKVSFRTREREIASLVERLRASK
ncbi:MAG: ATP phosphoribosyltransferase [Candidatus Verstraetearchaeota archaeon]|nr:ATP phosphoribosyltransferase [Candidatus Verstraetearchaeota archaeon]